MLPVTGEIVPLDDPARVADALKQLRELRGLVREVEDRLQGILVEESQRVGTKTLRYGALTAEVKGTAGGLEWDVEELQKLLDAGLPEGRYNELVQQTVEYKVNAAVAKQIEASGNEEYARIIDRARGRGPARPYVSVA